MRVKKKMYQTEQEGRLTPTRDYFPGDPPTEDQQSQKFTEGVDKSVGDALVNGIYNGTRTSQSNKQALEF